MTGRGLASGNACAAVWPAAGSGAAPNWLVVSITIWPASEPICSSAWGHVLRGTEITTTSPKPTASTGLPVVALGPISAASTSSDCGSRLKDNSTSWSAPASCRAMPPPIRPAPTMPTFISRASLRCVACSCGHANTGVLAWGLATLAAYRLAWHPPREGRGFHPLTSVKDASR